MISKAVLSAANFQLFIPALILVLTAVYIWLGALVIYQLETAGGNPSYQNHDKQQQNPPSTIPTTETPFLTTAISSTTPTSSMKFIDTNDPITNADLGKFELRELLIAAADNISVSTERQWTLGSSVLFMFSVVTTIGYGDIAPVTLWGRLFTIFYAVVGIPIGMLGIANIGQHLSKGILQVYVAVRRRCVRRTRVDTLIAPLSSLIMSAGTPHMNPTNEQIGPLGHKKPPPEPDPEDPDSLPYSIRVGCFLGWVFIGALLMPYWETGMGHWEAFWFCFISLTTIGFGDIYPTNFRYFLFTYVYLITGLVFTTMAIDVFADYLRRIHYYGRKLTNLGKTKIFFGSKQMTAHQLLGGVLSQLPVEKSVIRDAQANMDSLIANALLNFNSTEIGEENEEVEEEKASQVENPASTAPVSQNGTKPVPVDFDKVGYLDEVSDSPIWPPQSDSPPEPDNNKGCESSSPTDVVDQKGWESVSTETSFDDDDDNDDDDDDGGEDCKRIDYNSDKP